MDPRVTDVLLGVGIALGVAVVISGDWQGYAPVPALAYLFALGFGASMVLRRRLPRIVLLVTVLGIFVYYTLDYPPIGIALPAVAALYSAAEQARARAAAVAGAVLAVVSAYFRIQGGQPAAYLISYDLITNIALIAAAIALGVSVRLHRDTVAQADRIAALTAAAATQRAGERAQAERVQIARDLHDVVGHTLAAVTVHAHVAAEAIGSDDDAARRAIEQIHSSTAETMTELRGTVRVLRADPEGSDRPAPNLAGLEALMSSVREAGIAVEQEIDLAGREISAPIEAATFRIVQEALTNVLRHSRAGAVRLSIVADRERLRIEICDDGVGGGRVDAGRGRGDGNAAADDGAVAGAVGPERGEGGGDQVGHGIAGMTERARLLGGSLSAGPRHGRGYSVRAELPLRIGS